MFRYHYLLGADWRLCCRQLAMDKGLFFHAVYRIEQKLGRIFRELEPYPLYPLDEYFNGVTLEHRAIRTSETKVVALRPPLMRKPGQPLEELPGLKAA